MLRSYNLFSPLVVNTVLFYSVNKSFLSYIQLPNHSWPSLEISQFYIFTDISARNNMSLASHKIQSTRNLCISYVHPFSRREGVGCIPQFFCFQGSHTDPSRSIFQLSYNSCYDRLLTFLFWRIPYVGSSSIEFCLIFLIFSTDPC